MPSLLSDYEYDIFISYRHNDNLDGWVTQFVEAIEKELRGTLKESLTIYFDKNPHDGLLETHHVDKSLEGKLKCLIFIPILSQTYCDPKSFAWQHEFCAFNKLAQQDEIGRDIKLSSGNVASRILPIKIHELDAEDTAAIETEIGGVLRAIEFIYKEAGVNRPLAPEDSDEKNINKTKYKNQVNKVANAVKEIVKAVLNQKQPSFENSPTIAEKPNPKIKLWLMASLILVLTIAIASFFLIPRLNESKVDLETLDKSIAVLPFIDMSPQKDQEYFCDGISEEIINALVKIPNLKVSGRTSSFSFKNQNIDLKQIGEALGVTTVLEGSIRKSGNTLRITAQLVDTRNGFI